MWDVMPSGATMAKVEGWRVEARWSVGTASCASSTRTGTPAWASAKPITDPTGSAPTMMTFSSALMVLLCLEPHGSSRLRDGGQGRVSFGPRRAKGNQCSGEQ